MTLKIDFDKEFERRFRELAMRRFGFSKGSIKKAGEEAITLWIKMEKEDLPEVKDPIKLVRGIMKNIKRGSVGLQHETHNLWVKSKQ